MKAFSVTDATKFKNRIKIFLEVYVNMLLKFIFGYCCNFKGNFAVDGLAVLYIESQQ
jgi:hypothetical protein